MKGSLRMIGLMDMGFIDMLGIYRYIRVNFRMICSMVKESKCSKMEVNTMVNSNLERKMDLVNKFGLINHNI